MNALIQEREEQVRFFLDGQGDTWCVKKSRTGAIRTNAGANERDAFDAALRVTSIDKCREWHSRYGIDAAFLEFIEAPFDAPPPTGGPSVLSEKFFKNYREFRVDSVLFHAMRGENLWFVAQVGSDEITSVEAPESSSSRRLAEAAGLV